MITGFPSNAKYTKELYLNKKIDYNSANKILMFSHFSNPLFILSLVSNLIKNKNISLLILFSQYFSNIIIGIIIRNYLPENKYDSNYIDNISNEKISHKKFSEIFFNSIQTTINTLLLILGTVTTFLILSSLITEIFNLNIVIKTLLCGILEITQGIKQISLLNINLFYKGLFITEIISFGGLSVHTQIVNILNETNIKYKPFLLARILHTLISSIIYILCFKIYSTYIRIS